MMAFGVSSEHNKAIETACEMIADIDDVDVHSEKLVIKVGVFTPGKGCCSLVRTLLGPHGPPR